MACSASMICTIDSTSPSTKLLKNIMDLSWDREAVWPESEDAERRGRYMSSSAVPRDTTHSSMVSHLSLHEIEEEILRSTELQQHHAAVVLYLRLDIYLFQSIFALRNSGSGELAQLHPTLFTSPPESLFNLIYSLRLFDLDLADTISRIEAARFPGRPKEMSREPSGKIAPRGQAYECPSKYCKKVFIKSGHAANHVGKQHPEYLKLHPDYQPSHFLVEHQRSRPTSPELDRQDRQRASNKQPELRPNTTAPETPSVASEGLSIYFSDGAGGSWDRPSPRLQGYESQGDSDDAPRLVPSRNPSRTSNRPSPLHPTTPQDLYGHPSPDISRYNVLAGVCKRGRDYSSSMESLEAANQDEQGGTPRFRQYAKRRAIMGLY